MNQRLVGRRVAPVFIASALALLSATPAAAIDPGLDLQVDHWSSDTGRAYVGVKAAGQWAPPAVSRTSQKTEFYSEWVHQGNPDAYERAWWVYVHRTTDDSVLNVDTPMAAFTSSTEPGIGIRPAGYADLSLFLEVSVEPITAPARSERAVTAELTAGWRDYVDDALSTFVRRDSISVDRWTLDFGDGAKRTFPADRSVPDRLATTHAYEAGEFEVIATARVSGEAYAAFFTPDGVPFEEVQPFTLDISNRATGVAALPVEYVPPVVTVGAAPSGTVPGGGEVTAAAEGQAELYWPRGLPCALYVRAVVEQEGFMRSGGVDIGGATTRLVSYRYLGGVNDASGGTPPGTYEAGSPILIQWNTPLPGARAYPVRVVLELETTYEDGTVRSSEVEGTVSVTVIYSATGG